MGCNPTVVRGCAQPELIKPPGVGERMGRLPLILLP